MSDEAEAEARASLRRTARSLFARSLTHGSTGNISVRVGRRILVTPTGSSLGEVTVEDLAVIDDTGAHLEGPPPSKESFLHAALLRTRPQDNAVVHTHSTFAAALSCVPHDDPSNVFAPLTAYGVMRLGQVPLLPYHAPGDARLATLIEAAGTRHHALLLSNHGFVVSARSLAAAADALEEFEETAKLHLLLRGHPTRPLTSEQVALLSGSAGG